MRIHDKTAIHVRCHRRADLLVKKKCKFWGSSRHACTALHGQSHKLEGPSDPRIWKIVGESVGFVLLHHPGRNFTGRFMRGMKRRELFMWLSQMGRDSSRALGSYLSQLPRCQLMLLGITTAGSSRHGRIIWSWSASNTCTCRKAILFPNTWITGGVTLSENAILLLPRSRTGVETRELNTKNRCGPAPGFEPGTSG